LEEKEGERENLERKEGEIGEFDEELVLCQERRALAKEWREKPEEFFAEIMKMMKGGDSECI